MTMLIAGIMAIPTVYYEAAAIDGASGFKKFVISWIKQNTNSGTNHSNSVDDPNVTNFDLKVYNSSGTVIASSLFTTNNAELVGFDADSSNTDTIKIIRNDNFSSVEKLSYAYWE